MSARTYKLLGPDGVPYESPTKGTLGGHRRSRIYGRLDCPAAARAIARGGPYPTHRVFFADEATAVKAGYRPCAVCMRAEYRAWKGHVIPRLARNDGRPRELGSDSNYATLSDGTGAST